LVLVVLAGQPATAATVGTKPAQEAIAAANAKYVSLMNTDHVDAGALAAQYTDDAFLVIPALELITGKAAIQQSIAQTADQISNLTLSTLRVSSRGNLAFEVGKWSSSISGKTSVGNYLTTWRQVNGNWLRAGSCSVPETGANPVILGGTGPVPAPTAMAARSAVRVIGAVGAAEAAETITDLTQRYADAFNAGDGEALSQFMSNLYTPDAVVMIPESSLMMGAAPIMAACEAMANVVSNVSFDVGTVEVGTGGDLAFVLASYSNDVQAESGEVVSSRGSYLAVWALVGGQWKIAGSCTGDMGGTPEIGYVLHGTTSP
jgi:ketosteroid isomerase-like protein